MAPTTPTTADDIATRLEANALGTAGTDLFVDFEPPSLPNSVVVVVYNTGGLDPAPLAGKTLDNPTVQVMIIGPIDGVMVAQQRAQAIKELLNVTRFSVGATRYPGCFQQGDLVPMGNDEKRRPRYSRNFRLSRAYA